MTVKTPRPAYYPPAPPLKSHAGRTSREKRETMELKLIIPDTVRAMFINYVFLAPDGMCIGCMSADSTMLADGGTLKVEPKIDKNNDKSE